jgi:four helix bundle protein
MRETQKSKTYDIGERTLLFAKRVGQYARGLPKSVTNTEYGQQLVRSSGSVGANYIEAEEALSKKDFLMRIKISRKEAKESRYWLELTESSEARAVERQSLIQEATELTRIFGSIVEKSRAS